MRDAFGKVRNAIAFPIGIPIALQMMSMQINNDRDVYLGQGEGLRMATE